VYEKDRYKERGEGVKDEREMERERNGRGEREKSHPSSSRSLDLFPT